MAWKVSDAVALRNEFVLLAQAETANVAGLCRRFGIARKTGYKWLARYRTEAEAGLVDRSRRPDCSPRRCCAELERRVIELRKEHPAWGARKLKRRLEDLKLAMPARSTVHGILRRHGLVDEKHSGISRPMIRFEKEHPNELWQMDFKGPIGTERGACHALTMLDDCSRFNLLLRACENQQLPTVREALIDVLRRYGMPLAILADNGSPWGDCSKGEHWTELEVWLMRRGIEMIHGRPSHPQTQGKEERFHRTLNIEAIGQRRFADPVDCQRVFDDWREVYNHQRPHEALKLATPVSRYQPSNREYPETLQPIEYGQSDIVRRVCAGGRISYKSREAYIGKAFIGQSVALRATTTDGQLNVYYCHQQVAAIDLRAESVSQ